MTLQIQAIILAGGRGSRLGGADKALLRYDDQTLLDRLLVGLSPLTADVVVVGQPRPLASATPVTWTLESPSGGGPLAGLAAGVAALAQTSDDAWVIALACDQPFAELAFAPLIAAARQAGPDIHVVLGVDHNGRSQALTAIYRAGALVRALAELGNPDGLPMRALVRQLTCEEILLPALASQDVDTFADLTDLGVTQDESETTSQPQRD